MKSDKIRENVLLKELHMRWKGDDEPLTGKENSRHMVTDKILLTL